MLPSFEAARPKRQGMVRERAIPRIEKTGSSSGELLLACSPTVLTASQRFSSWLKDILLSRGEGLWTLLAFLIVETVAVAAYTSVGGRYALTLDLLGRLCIMGIVFAFTAKGLDTFKKEKRLFPRPVGSLLMFAWAICIVPSCFLVGTAGAFVVLTSAAAWLCAMLWACIAFLRPRPKTFFVIGTPTKTTASIHLFCAKAEKSNLNSFYWDVEESQLGRFNLSTVVVTRGGVGSREAIDFLKRALQSGVNIVDEKEFYVEIFGRLPVFGNVHDCDVIVGMAARLPLSETAMRIFDILLAAIALIFLAPLMVLVAIVIRLDTKGPVFFLQRREGRNNVPFNIFKYRTMLHSDSEGPLEFTKAFDPRVTRVGKILRHFHLDELPQFLNVLRGEMSLVGPRPEALSFAQEMREQVPAYDIRYAVRPGITGVAQLNQGYALGEVSATLEKLSYDFYYLERRNVWMDLSLLLRTMFFIWHDTSYRMNKKPSQPALDEAKVG